MLPRQVPTDFATRDKCFFDKFFVWLCSDVQLTEKLLVYCSSAHLGEQIDVEISNNNSFDLMRAWHAGG